MKIFLIMLYTLKTLPLPTAKRKRSLRISDLKMRLAAIQMDCHANGTKLKIPLPIRGLYLGGRFECPFLADSRCLSYRCIYRMHFNFSKKKLVAEAIRKVAEVILKS